MVRRRADESVPAVEHGIGEVVIQHRQTRRGVWTTEKVVPVLIPEKPKPGWTSCSKKAQKGQIDPDLAEHMMALDPIMDLPQAPAYFDEQVSDTFDIDAVEGMPKKSNVCVTNILL
jgi:hypothetical protein